MDQVVGHDIKGYGIQLWAADKKPSEMQMKIMFDKCHHCHRTNMLQRGSKDAIMYHLITAITKAQYVSVRPFSMIRRIAQ